MRALTVLFVLAAAAITAQATSCPSIPQSNPFAPSTCTGFLNCNANLCGCVGGNVTSPAACIAQSTESCLSLDSCLASYFTCVSALSTSRLVANDTCMSFGTTMHAAQLAATQYVGSQLQQSCQYNLCQLVGSANCSSWEGVCTNATTNGSPAPSWAPTTAAPMAYALLVTLRLSGNNWGPILTNPTLYQNMVTAITGSLAQLLDISATYIDIVMLTQGSLNVDFVVLDGSGATATALATTLMAATSSTSWLAGTQTAYALTNPGEVLSALTVSTSTQAPTTTPTPSGPTPTPTPTPNSPSGAQGIFTAAGLAVAAMMMAVLA